MLLHNCVDFVWFSDFGAHEFLHLCIFGGRSFYPWGLLQLICRKCVFIIVFQFCSIRCELCGTNVHHAYLARWQAISAWCTLQGVVFRCDWRTNWMQTVLLRHTTCKVRVYVLQSPCVMVVCWHWVVLTPDDTKYITRKSITRRIRRQHLTQ